uniref:Putative conserved secreted protein n=1 Tax=Ixodes ricinus TaxID=34613 RepID=A0A6B0V5I9_IXORI
MDATKRLWIAFQVFVLTGGVYGGTWNKTVEQYVDKIIEKLYDEVRDMKLEDNPIMMQNVDIFLNESAIPTTIPSISLGTFSGLGTTFNRTGRCYVREKKKSESRVTCTVGFTNLQATLPNNEDVLQINTSGLLVISVPKGERKATVSLMTLSSVNFTMTVNGLNKDTPDNKKPTYIPNEKIPIDIKTTYRLVFQKFITQDKFKSALDAALSTFPKVRFKMVWKPQKKKKRQSLTELQKKKKAR